MKLTFIRSLTAAAVMVSAMALAQTSGASSAALPAAPGAASEPPIGVSTGGSKIGAINVEQAIFASNEGQRDFEALSKKLEPKQNELKAQNDEIESLTKQLNTQGASLNDDAKGNLTRQIEQKKKALERSVQDAQEDARTQENEIAQRILQKMGPLIIKYANDNGYGMIVDTSTNNQWPQGAILWHATGLDITKPVVDAYNVQSGVPAPKAGTGTGARPAGGTGTKPAGSSTKPSTSAPAATKPSTSTPAATKPAGTQPPK